MRSRDARRRTGYLPQSSPLYDEMRVRPFLETMCRLRGVPPDVRRTRVDDALAACGLAGADRETIGALPAWRRRRVGLAQAVVHDPEVLLLDEPAEDLDLDRAVELQALIAELARGRTVLLSGRELSDVSGVCDRVLVIEAGRRVAEDATADLGRRLARPRSREVTAVVSGDRQAVAEVLSRVRALPGVAEAAVSEADGDSRLTVTVTGEVEDLQDAIARVVIARGLRLKELGSREPRAVDTLAAMARRETR
jgi:ABC-2 type transport system ATP-binding protein